MRKYIIAGNWKMNGEFKKSQILTSEILNMYKDEVKSGLEVVLCPPFISIPEVKRLVKDTGLKVGAQNCHQEESGAFTGEISAGILASYKLDYIIVGHSERRQYFDETNSLLAQKIDQVHRHHITPIYCVGETLEERDENRHFEIIEQQLSEGLFHLSNINIQRTVIAYEPVWAIGTGKTATNDEAQEIHSLIRDLIARRYSQHVADSISILYGGSVNPKNAKGIFAMPDIDGGLIGGASLKSRDFIAICKSVPA